MSKKKGLFVKGTYFDYPLLFLIVFLVMFGLIMVYSASSFIARTRYGSSTYFAFRQFLFAGVGFVAMFIVSKVRYQTLRKWTMVFITLQVILLIMVFIIGESKNGSSRWIQIGPIGFQPSEIAKMVIVLYMAHICTAADRDLNDIVGTIKVFLVPGILIIIIAIENLSTALICAAIAGGIWFVATPKLRYVGVVVVAAIVFGVIMISTAGYRAERIVAWLHPEESEKGYQTLQGLYAIASGGLFGRGLGQSVQKMGFIPEAQNDMIFSIVCEELGIVGAAVVIGVFLMLLWRMKFIAEGAPDRFGAFIVVGVLSHIAVQVLMNMAVVTNVMPNTGVPLPFISYGGTSIVFTMIEVGLVLAVSRQIVPLGQTNAQEG